MEPALHELSEGLATLSVSIDKMVKAERRRTLRSWGTLALVIVMAWFGITNRTILDKIDGVTGPAAQARSAAQVKDILLRNAIETDCRSRRQQVRVPAPDPAKPCIVQTPLDIYPGTIGQPSKGTP